MDDDSGFIKVPTDEFEVRRRGTSNGGARMPQWAVEAAIVTALATGFGFIGTWFFFPAAKGEVLCEKVTSIKSDLSDVKKTLNLILQNQMAIAKSSRTKMNLPASAAINLDAIDLGGVDITED